MKLLGKKLYRTRPVKLYKGGFGGGGGPINIPSVAVTPPTPPAQELTEAVEWQGPPGTASPIFGHDPIGGHDGPIDEPQPAIEPPQAVPVPIEPPPVGPDVETDHPGYSVGVPGTEGFQTFPHRPDGWRPPQRPVDEIPPDPPSTRPVLRPWDEEESFSFEEFIDDPGEGAPQPPTEIPWEQEPQLPSLSGGWGGPEAEGPGIHHQAPPLQMPQRPEVNIPAEGPAGEGEVQTLRQTVAELRKEIASLRQQLAAAKPNQVYSGFFPERLKQERISTLDTPGSFSTR